MRNVARFILLALILNLVPYTQIARADADITPPVIDFHADIIAEATSSSGVVVTYTAPNAVDDVDPPFAATCAPASDTLFALGDSTVTCNATDSSGNLAVSTNFTITVVDTTAPAITRTGNSVVEVTVNTLYSDAGATASDVVDGDLTASIITVNPVNTEVIGSYTVSYNVSDAAGNAASQVIRTVNVNAAPDTIPPIIAAQDNIIVESSSGASIIVNYTAPNAVDNVDPTFAATCTPASGTLFGLGDTTVTCNATDAAGNHATPTSFTVTVQDTTAPTLTQVTPVVTPTHVTTPSYTFSTNEAGIIHYAGGCLGIDTSADVGNNTITFNALAEGTYAGCTVAVTDSAGNPSIPLSVASFTVATLVEDTPVHSPTNNTTPDYKVHSAKLGTFLYGPQCVGKLISVIPSGSLYTYTIKFGSSLLANNTLVGLLDGIYDSCTVALKYAQGSSFLTSAPLLVRSFTIDTVPPVAVLSGVPASATNNTTADITVGGNGVVNYKYKLETGGTWSTSRPIIDHIILTGLGDGEHKLYVVGQDAAGNWQLEPTESDPTHIWNIDIIPPSLSEVTSVSSPTNDPTPDYTFRANEPGNISYFGGCSSATASAVIGDNPISFLGLASGIYASCSLKVTDTAGNISAPLSISPFTVDVTPPATVVLSGVPPLITALSEIHMTVASDGAVKYKYKIDSASLSAEYDITAPIHVANIPSGIHTIMVITRDDLGNWQPDPITPTYAWRILASPQGTPPPGVHTVILPSVQFSSLAATSIRYATDGSVPTCIPATGTPYTTGLYVDRTTTFKTVACDATGVATPVAELPYTMNLTYTDQGVPGYRELIDLLNDGVLSIPVGYTNTSTPTTTAALGFTVLALDSSTIEIPVGTVISSINGINFDVLAFHNPEVSPFVSGLGQFPVDGVIQWGVENTSLRFSNPITIRIFVGTSLNGQTLNIRGSSNFLPAEAEHWNTDGIVSPTCLIANGFCAFTATQSAVYYAAYHVEPQVTTPPPASGGGSTGGGSTSSSSGGGGGGGGGGGAGGAPTIVLPSDGTISINNGASETATTTVTLTLNSLNATKMALSNTSDFKGSFWEIYATSTPWRLSNAKGLKTVYVRYRNDQGVAKVVSDTITLTVEGTSTVTTGGPVSGAPTEDDPKVLGFQYDDVVTIEKSLVTSIDKSLIGKVLGLILLQVQSLGRAWYVDPVSTQKFYLADGPMAYSALRKFGLGIRNADLAKIPVGMESRFVMDDMDSDRLPDKLEEALGTRVDEVDTDGDGASDGDEVLKAFTNPLGSGRSVFSNSLVKQLKGRIVLQVESKGEAWYIYPVDGKRYYLANGEAAYQIMRFLSLGITNDNLRKIGVGDITQ